MLRRQRDSAGALRGLLSPKSCSRSSTAAFVLHGDAGSTACESEGLLSRLKGIFNKTVDGPNEGRKSHEAAAATRDHPEVAAAVVTAANPLRKVDVVNQKLANFGAAGSTTKFGDRKLRVGKINVGDCGRTSAIQQLAIYAESPRPSSCADFARRQTRDAPERGRGSTDFTSRLAPPVEIHRAEKIGRGAIEFAARDDSAAAAHYRCYTSPRHCYRLPPPRTKQPAPLLLATYGSNRNIGVPTRAIAAFAGGNSRPPIREPNMPEKRERRNGEKKDKKEKKEPVIRTKRESVDSSESRAAMLAGDNPSGDPDAPFRYEWGVKFAEEEPAGASDNDNLAKKGRRYVTKRLWGVNLTQPKPDVENAAPPTSESPGRGAYEHRNASRIFEGNDAAAAAEAGGTKGQGSSKPREQHEWDPRTGGKERVSTSTASDGSVAEQEDETDATSPRVRQTIMKPSPGMSRETIALGDIYNVPEDAAENTEINAWRDMAIKSKSAIQDVLSAAQPEKLEMMSIRPEAPRPKLDVQVVRSIDDIRGEKSNEEQPAGRKLSSIGLKHTTAPTEVSSMDNYSPSKKLHTASAQIPSAFWASSDVTRRYVGSLPVNSTSVYGTARAKTPRTTSSAFSTSFEDSKEEKMSDNVSNRQDGRRTDSRSFDEEKSSSSDASNSLESTMPILSAAESQSASASDQKRADVEIDFTETSANIIADKEIEVSAKQSQDADREAADRASDSARKDESRMEDESVRGETARPSYGDSYSNYYRTSSYEEDVGDASSYANYSVETVEGDSLNSRGLNSAEEVVEPIYAKNTIGELNAEDLSENFGRRYVADDDDYVRLLDDPYPYKKENLEKWKMPMQSGSSFYKLIKRETLFSGPLSDGSTPRNANDAYANAAGQPYGSHAAGTVMETSGSGDAAMGAKNVRLANRFRVSSPDQRVVAPDYDAADMFELRGWTKAFSRLDNAGTGATASRKTSEAKRGDNASLRAYRE